jgi:aryl carrier-like protein
VDVAVKEPLDAAAVRETVVELEARIAARFPTRGLRKAAADLATLIDAVEASATETQGRIRVLRVASRVLMLCLAAATVAAVGLATRDATEAGLDSFRLLPLIETVINDVVFAGIAVFFLYSFPERLQRGRLLNLLHQLRSTAHIIDMHQLSKDPEQLRPTFVPTPVSRPLEMTRDEMERYLDYCSELLALVGKTAALCAEESRDSLVLETVSTIETLTVSISRKIWQKISTLPAPDDAAPA